MMHFTFPIENGYFSVCIIFPISYLRYSNIKNKDKGWPCGPMHTSFKYTIFLQSLHLYNNLTSRSVVIPTPSVLRTEQSQNKFKLWRGKCFSPTLKFSLDISFKFLVLFGKNRYLKFKTM